MRSTPYSYASKTFQKYIVEHKVASHPTLNLYEVGLCWAPQSKKNINLIVGKLKLPNNSEGYFYLSAFGNSEDGFYFKNSSEAIRNKSIFPSLLMTKENIMGDFNFCLRAKFGEKSNSTLELYPTNCNYPSGVICRQDIFVQPLCDSNNVENDELQLSIDPLLRDIKEKIIAPERKTWVDFFNRLNKTVAFEALFR